MDRHLRNICILSTLGLLLMIPPLEASPRFWPWQTRSSPSSIVNISIGNRVNTHTELDERSTVVRDLAINLSQWNGNFTLARNGTEISVTRDNDGIIKIRITFDSNTNGTNSTATNSTISRRRKRATGIPSIAAGPIPTVNGSLAFLDGNIIALPNAITNSTFYSSINDIRDLLQPWQFLQTFLNRRLPMQMLDTLVSFLSQLYSSTGKRMIETGINIVGETTDHFSNIVNSTLDFVTEQASAGMKNVVRTFKDLSPGRRSCVGQIPDDAARPVVSKATGCVQYRWNSVEDILNQFLDVISSTEEAYGGWLQALERCNARYFEGLSDSQLDTRQRDCYAQTIANSVSKLIDIPMRWSDLAFRTNSAVASFQPLVAMCVAGVGAEIASISTEIGLKIMFCQIL